MFHYFPFTLLNIKGLGPMQPLQDGDKVRLSPSASQTGGCLGRPEYGFIGIINGTVTSTTTSINVMCWDAKGSPYEPQLIGKFPSWSYNLTDLIPANYSEEFLPMPLVAGDRVCLSPNFTENNQDGWCLGKPSDQKVGVELFAPSGIFSIQL